ncbi:MAG: hypothetical protein AABM42_12035 [Actinomycetota bacterium]
MVDQRHRAHLPGLRRPVGVDRVGATDEHHPPYPVDVAPPETTELTKAEAGEGSDGEHGGVLRGDGVGGQQLNLVRLQSREVAGTALRLALGTLDRVAR